MRISLKNSFILVGLVGVAIAICTATFQDYRMGREMRQITKRGGAIFHDSEYVDVRITLGTGCREFIPGVIPSPHSVSFANDDLAMLLPLNRRITVLCLDGTKVDDVGLRTVAKLGRLRALSLRATKIDGSGLHYLKELPELAVLNLAQASVGDASVKVLGEFPLLRRVDLRETQVSVVAAEKLRAMNPDLVVLSNDAAASE